MSDASKKWNLCCVFLLVPYTYGTSKNKSHYNQWKNQYREYKRDCPLILCIINEHCQLPPNLRTWRWIKWGYITCFSVTEKTVVNSYFESYLLPLRIKI